MQKMRGPEDCYCPMWRKPMSKVCHTCPWWMQIRGTDKNTGAEIDKWECSIALLPTLQIENAHAVRGTQAATESMRNEMAKMHIEGTNAISHAITSVGRQPAIDVTPNIQRLTHERN